MRILKSVRGQSRQREMLRFFIPLAIQSASQSLTWPLVASIVSHGKGGPSEYAAFTQGQMVMFMLGAIGLGMIPTGMVFCKSATGMRNFFRLNQNLMLATAIMQLTICLPPFDAWVFELFLGLTPEFAVIARNSLLACIPVQLLFYSRNANLVALYNEKRSGLANSATIVRIVMMLLISPFFVRIGWVGWMWGSVAMTISVFFENILMRRYATPFIRALPDGPGLEKASVAKQFHFTIPLSFGGMMLSLSGLLLAMFLARTPDPETALPVHYILMGVINPMGFAALRMQSVTIAFPPEECGNSSRPAFLFACWMGFLLCLVPLVAQIPAIGNWYFMEIQNLPAEKAGFAAEALLCISVLPLVQALRGNAEGCAALRRRPNAILAGQAMYLATLVLLLWFFVRTNIIPGYIMGALSMLGGMIAAFLTIRIALIANDLADQYGYAGSPVHRE